ncbi:MAG TPA: hypothetical protein VLI54_06295 [Bacillota bacterium]|nr:hypothetical protein [Bacillota bacterium]
MLQLSGMIINRPVLSLRTGTQVATALSPIVNPANLKIEGFFCHDSLSRQTLILVAQDVRDLLPQGIVINDHDVLTEPSELVRLSEIININFQLLGKTVVTNSRSKLGKISDYAVETTSMYIQKLYVSQSVFKSLSGGNLGIDRSQIVEITDKQVVVNDLTQNVPVGARAVA